MPAADSASHESFYANASAGRPPAPQARRGAKVRRAVAHRAPRSLRNSVREARTTLSVWPPVGTVRYGTLRRTSPLGTMWPNRRGAPVDRYYIERFLERERVRITGDVLEVGDVGYTKRFGTEVRTAEVLHSPIGGSPGVHWSIDLSVDELPADRFDCVVLPQTLLFVYDLRHAVSVLHTALRPGGSLLLTVPGITPIVRDDMENWGQFWSFTEQSVRRLLGECFGSDFVTVTAWGNVLTSTAFLYNLSQRDVPKAAFEQDDPDYPLIIAAVARKAEAG